MNGWLLLVVSLMHIGYYQAVTDPGTVCTCIYILPVYHCNCIPITWSEVYLAFRGVRLLRSRLWGSFSEALAPNHGPNLECTAMHDTNTLGRVVVRLGTGNRVWQYILLSFPITTPISRIQGSMLRSPRTCGKLITFEESIHDKLLGNDNQALL